MGDWQCKIFNSWCTPCFSPCLYNLLNLETKISAKTPENLKDHLKSKLHIFMWGALIRFLKYQY